jgi:hypothetical protein
MKSKRYWLRGGLWVGGIYAILAIIYIIFAYLAEGRNDITHGAGFGLVLIPLVVSGIPTTLLLDGIAKLLPYFLTHLIDHSVLGSAVLVLVFVLLNGLSSDLLSGGFMVKLKIGKQIT